MFKSLCCAGEGVRKCVCTVCVCTCVLISFIYSSAGRSADASQRERRHGVRGRDCEIKCERERNPEMYPSIHPSGAIVMFDVFIKHKQMNREWRDVDI